MNVTNFIPGFSGIDTYCIARSNDAGYVLSIFAGVVSELAFTCIPAYFAYDGIRHNSFLELTGSTALYVMFRVVSK